jgi:uncharacterized membrane protein
MSSVLELIWITLIPALELRASIPYGILNGMSWIAVFLVCVITNIILGIFVYYFLEKFIIIVKKIRFIEKLWNKYVAKIQRKIHKAVEKWGEMAVAVFIAIPLPGSGVYSGALAAYLIDLDFKKFVIANIIGVLIAGIIVTILSLTGAEIFQVFIKTI